MDPTNALQDYSYSDFMDPSFQLFGGQSLDYNLTDSTTDFLFPESDCNDLLAPPSQTDFNHASILSWTDVSLPASCVSEEQNHSSRPALRASMSSSNTLEQSVNESATLQTLPQEQHMPQEVVHSSAKRKWDNSVIVFSLNPDKKVKVRTRRCFTAPRKEEVKMTRTIGACTLCRVGKTTCDPFGFPCSGCVKRAGSDNLGRELCNRQRLVAIRFSNVDLLRMNLHSEVLSATKFLGKQTQRRLSIFWPGCCHPSAKVTMDVQVQDIVVPARRLDTMLENSQILREIGFNIYREHIEPDFPYMITDDCIPTLTKFETYKNDADHCCDTGPFDGLHLAFAWFCSKYCSLENDMPLQDLMRRIMKLKRLFNVYHIAPMVKGENEMNSYTSSWVKMQLRLLVAKEITKLEVQILGELDRVVYRSGGIGTGNSLALWVCLWVLILTYRSHFVYSPRTPLYKTVGNSVSEASELTKHIYHTLTSIYTALFRNNSPMLFDWRNEEVHKMLGHDEKLIYRLAQIKTEMLWCYASRHELFPEDSLLKTLVLENENKLHESKKKEARRRGLI